MLNWIREKVAASRAAEAAAEEKARIEKEKARAVAAYQEKEALNRRELQAKIEARFPPHVLFRIPPVIVEITENKSWEDDPLEHAWVAMMDKYPEPPHTEKERIQRDANLWCNLMSDFYRQEPDGSPALAPRGEIDTFFRQKELWVLRWYYAATGQLIRTTHEEHCRLLIDCHRGFKKLEAHWKESDERDKKFKGQPRSQVFADIERNYKAAYDASSERLRAYREKLQAEHMDKWSGWFVKNIEAAFQREFGQQRQPQQNIYGDGGFATWGNIRTVQGATVTVTAQNQVFRT